MRAFQSTHPMIRMRPDRVLPATQSMGQISIHAPEDPDATVDFQARVVNRAISIHASKDPDATANAKSGLDDHHHFNPRTRRSGCDRKQWSGKATSKFTAKTKCFEFTKASLNKTFTRISWCETPVTFMCNSGSHAFLRQQFSSKDHSKTTLPLLYCPI